MILKGEFMKKLPIVVLEKKNDEECTKYVFLETKGDITKKTVRARIINNYAKNKFGNKMSLCADCVLGTTECPKLADISKKLIFQYPFIEKGFQIQDVLENLEDKKYVDDNLENPSEYEREVRENDLRIEKFVIEKCKKFRGKR